MTLKQKIQGILAILGIGTAGILGGLNYRENIPLQYIYTDSATTTAGTGIEVSNYMNIACDIISQATTGTLKFMGSIQDAQPVWDSIKSATNTWDYVEAIDNMNGVSYDGDTGVVMTNSSDVRDFRINVDLLKWFNADFTSYSSGTTTVPCKVSNNQ